MTLTSGPPVLGVVYLRQGQRILDMLCDDRLFFPVKSKSGTSLFNKNTVMRVDVMEIKEITERKDLFPDISEQYLVNNVW